MRVVFLEDVPGVAQGGDVKEVKNGFARNYLIPKSLATPATHNALQRVQKLSRHADVTRVKRLEDMRELASEIEGAQIEVEMRAGSTGRLYGSVTSAIIAEQLGEVTEREIDRRTVDLEEPIRDLGEYGGHGQPASRGPGGYLGARVSDGDDRGGVRRVAEGSGGGSRCR